MMPSHAKRRLLVSVSWRLRLCGTVQDVWKDAGSGVYNCTYPDGLTDMGRMVQLFTDTVRITRDRDW